MEQNLNKLNEQLAQVTSIDLKPWGPRSARVEGEVMQVVKEFRARHGGAGDVHTSVVHVTLRSPSLSSEPK